jgi:hypothetical protein
VELKNTLEIPAPPDAVWAYMLDVERVVPCMPGAELTETVDDSTWKGKVAVKLGPVSLSFAGTVTMQERNDADRIVVLKADGRETRGKGSASASVTSTLEPNGDGTRMVITTDLTISGAVAQYGRGMIGDVSQRLADRFAECLAARVSAEQAAGEAGEAAAAAPAPTAAKPVGGIGLAFWALLRAIARFVRRLLGRAD